MKITPEVFSNELGTGVWLTAQARELIPQDSTAREHGARENNPTALAFFGSSLARRENLERKFPRLTFVALKQTHSDILVASSASSSSEPPEADAHWTQAPDVALAIRTADCVPVLLVDLQARLVVSIHAGWRGVENQIICKSMTALRARGFDFESAVALIGPHIGVGSFEVGRDIASKLEAAYAQVRETGHLTSLRPHADPEKARVDLLQIVRAQLNSCGISLERQIDLSLDTVQSPAHESFRRDREFAGRQMSFVALVNPPEL